MYVWGLGCVDNSEQSYATAPSTDYFWEGKNRGTSLYGSTRQREREEREMSEIELDLPAKTLNSHSGRKKRR